MYLHTKFNIPSSSGSLVIDVKLIAKWTFSCSHLAVVLRSTENWP